MCLHSLAGFDAFSFDPHKFAMDYHSIGFRECASEVARYLVASEGMDLQDPMRLRMMSHLQCYAAQRELALKSSAHASVWNPSAFTTPSQFPSSSTMSIATHTSSVTDSSGYTPHLSALDSNSMSSHMMPPPPPLFSASKPGHHSASDASSQVAASASSPYTPSGAANIMTPVGGHQMSSSGQYFGGYAPPGASSQHQGGSVKHYRPWGAELAY